MLSSEDLERDIEWYMQMLGFQILQVETKFALIQRGDFFIHLQKQKADSKTLIGGSVAKFFVDDIQIIFYELVNKNLINEDQLVSDPASGTIEFEISDPSGNTIIFIEENR